MNTNTRMAEIMQLMAKEAPVKAGLWESILPRISKGTLIPIISSSFRLEQIFRELATDNELTVVEELVAQWAARIEYPMQDNHNLARVAQYYLVEQNDDPNARTEMVSFLKLLLLAMASTDGENRERAISLKNKIQEKRFSDLVTELEYPRFPDAAEDSLRVLARLPLPIYVTTSQSNFIERALIAEDKKPITQLCFWSGEISNVIPAHRTDPDFTPTVTTPLVYHLYGLEDYPQTLVLSEDDFINFLLSVVEDTNMLNPKVPLYVRRALGESQLILIGYRLTDWDFRVLFRFLLKFRTDGFSPRGMLIQLKQMERDLSNEKALGYLGRYFGKRTFDIEWSDTEAFIRKLWNEWDTYRKNQ
jgi:SIR2-like domain